jgi:hypothetical protein
MKYIIEFKSPSLLGEGDLGGEAGLATLIPDGDPSKACINTSCYYYFTSNSSESKLSSIFQ